MYRNILVAHQYHVAAPSCLINVMHYRFSILMQIQIWLGRQHAIAWAMLAAVVLMLPSLFSGMLGDDYFIRAAVLQNTGIPCVPRTPVNAFTFSSGDPIDVKQGIEVGLYPWWTHPRRKMSFFRPLPALTHWLDFKLFPASVPLMHVHSILWYALLVYVAGLLYRRFLVPFWVAGLATLFYAVDYSHAFGAGMLCGRYAIMAAVFGVLTLLTHDSGHNGSRTCSIIAPVAFVVSLLCGESAIATGGYLVAYVLFIERGKPSARLASLLPYVVIVCTWWIIYTWFGYGTAHIGPYINPGQSVPRFLLNLMQCLPVLLLGHISLPPSDLWSFLPAWPARIYAACAAAGILLVVWGIWPLLARDRTARFFALGTVLAAIPFCASLPSNRHLFFTGLGSMGLISGFFALVLEKPAWFAPYWRMPRTLITGIWFFSCAVVFPLLFAPATLVNILLQKPLTLAAQTIAPQNDECLSGQTLVVNITYEQILFFIPFIRAANGQNPCLNTFLLSAGLEPVEVQRVNDRTLVVRIRGGMLRRTWEQFFRDSASPLEKGYTLQLPGFSATVTALTDDGLPAELQYIFNKPLEDRSLKWLTWSDDGFIPFVLPAAGETIKVKPAPIF
jgi:hypothetical protein